MTWLGDLLMKWFIVVLAWVGLERESTPERFDEEIREMKRNIRTLKKKNRDDNTDLNVRFEDAFEKLTWRASVDAEIWAERYIVTTGGEFIQFLLGRYLWTRAKNYFEGTDDQMKIRRAAVTLGIDESFLVERFMKIYRFRNDEVQCSTWSEIDSRIEQCRQLFDRHRGLKRQFYHQYFLLSRADKMKAAFRWS